MAIKDDVGQMASALNDIKDSLTKIVAQFDTVNGKAKQAAQAGQQISQSWVPGIQKAAGAIRTLTTVTAGFLAGWKVAALSGTYEAAQLGKAFDYLAKQAGDGLAPFVRGLTQGVMLLADGFRSLDDGTKQLVAGVGLSVTAFGGLLFALPTIVSVVSALGSVFAALISPIGLVATAITAGIVALVAWQVSTKGWEQTVTDAIQVVIEGWYYLKASFSAVVAYVSTRLENDRAATEAWAQNMVAMGKWIADNWKQYLIALPGVMANVFSAMTDMQSVFGAQFLAWVKGGFQGALKFDFGDMAQNLRNAMVVGVEPFPQMVEAKVEDPLMAAVDAFEKGLVGIGDAGPLAKGLVGLGKDIAGQVQAIFARLNAGGGLHLNVQASFESLQGTFERIQKALVDDPGQSKDEQTLDMMRKLLQTITDALQNGVKIQPRPIVG